MIEHVLGENHKSVLLIRESNLHCACVEFSKYVVT